MTAVLFRAGCPACGPVTLASAEVELVCGASVGYRFMCPVCEVMIHHPASELTEAVLLAAGTRVSDARWPAELAEPHGGAAISEAEIAAFAAALTLAEANTNI